MKVYYATQSELDAYLAKREAKCAIADPLPIYVVGEWVDPCAVVHGWLYPEYLGYLLDANNTTAIVIAQVGDPTEGRYDVDHIYVLQDGSANQPTAYQLNRLRVMARGDHPSTLEWYCDCYDAWRIEKGYVQRSACGHALLAWSLSHQSHAETLRRLYERHR